jgi:hypothetical protein
MNKTKDILTQKDHPNKDGREGTFNITDLDLEEQIMDLFTMRRQGEATMALATKAIVQIIKRQYKLGEGHKIVFDDALLARGRVRFTVMKDQAQHIQEVMEAPKPEEPTPIAEAPDGQV